MHGSASHESSKILSFQIGTGGFDSLGANFAIDLNSQSFLEQSGGSSWTLVYGAVKHREIQSRGELSAVAGLPKMLPVKLGYMLLR